MHRTVSLSLSPHGDFYGALHCKSGSGVCSLARVMSASRLDVCGRRTVG